ncbi:MAG: metallophosphoesterase family protein [Ardenticatenaceae bacterium]|nr:metallophosphoesterase family protein [Ardenticatenaceae bacterium]
MKIAIITDVHANLPALEAALAAIAREGCDQIIHLGDVIGIGPYPSECLELMLNVTQMEFVMGNHDEWFANGLPRPQPEWMSDGEVAHQRWTHEQLDSALKVVVGQWPIVWRQTFGETAVFFTHYALHPTQRGFAPVVKPVTAVYLNHIFARMLGKDDRPPTTDHNLPSSVVGRPSSVVFYGHDHAAADISSGERRFINPGPLGVGREAVARFTTAVFAPHQPVAITHHTVPYDDRELYHTFEKRQVPERNFLYRVFYGGRFGRR